MKKQFIFLFSLLGLVFTACEKNDPASDGNEQEEVKDIKQFVNVAAGQTAIPDYGQLPGTSAKFKVGDEISIYSWKNAKDDTSGAISNIYILNEDGWTPKTENDSMFWEKSNEQLYFAAVYPTREIQDLKADKMTTNDADILVSNIMNGVKPQEDAIRFTFTHLFSKVVMNFTYGTEHPETNFTEKTVTLKNIASKGFYNHLDKTAVPSEEKEDFTLTQDGEKSTFYGIIFPQEMSEIQFSGKIEDKEYTYSFKPESLSEVENVPINFLVQPNKIYTYNFKVGKNKLELQSVTVKEWVTGAVISGNADKEESVSDGNATDPIEN